MRKISTFGSILLLFCLAFPPTIADASIVTFDLRGTDGPFDFDDETGTHTDPSGLTGFFEAFVVGNTGTINATGSGFGVNANGGGDDTDQLDGDEGNESIQITFSGPVSATLTSIEISSFGVDDSGTLDIGGNSSAIAGGSSTVIPTHTELVGSSLTIAFTGGNGFSIDSLEFHVKAIPEPSSLALIGLLGLGFATRRRR